VEEMMAKAIESQLLGWAVDVALALTEIFKHKGIYSSG